MTSRLLVDKIEGKTTASTVQMPSGSIIQLVNTTNSSAISTTSSSDGDTGITLDVTPKFANSKLWMVFSARIYNNGGGHEYYIKIKDGSTQVGGGATFFDGGDRMAESCTFQTIVSTNTTSTKTYKITHAVSGGTGTISPQNAIDFATNFTIVEVAQ